MKIKPLNLAVILVFLAKTGFLQAQISITTCSNNVVANITSATTATLVNNSGSSVLLLIEAKGGGGGGGKDGDNPNYPGGEGATVSGRFILNSNATLFIISGGKGSDYNGAYTSTSAAFSGGGGGGSGAVHCGNPANCATGTVLLIAAAGGGGGASHISYGGSVTSMACGNGGATQSGAAAGGGGCLSAGTSSDATNGGGAVLKTGLVAGGTRGCFTCTPGAQGMGGGGGGGGSYGGGGGGATGGTGDGSAAAISYNIGSNQVNTAGGNGATGTAGFVRVTCISTTTLPVELLSFKGQNTEGGQNRLKWQTAEEKNVKDFEVERSLDGQFFTTVGTVKAKGSYAAYEFIDKTLARFGISPMLTSATLITTYYRLKINDLDGKTAFSKIISLTHQNTEGGNIRLYPNPVFDVLTIENGQGKALEIVNALGQTVMTQSLKNVDNVPNQTLDVKRLPSGVYFLKNGRDVSRFVKN